MLLMARARFLMLLTPADSVSFVFGFGLSEFSSESGAQ